MNKKVKSAIGCAVLFTLSALILRQGSDTGLPSEDYGMSVKEVFYMYAGEASAIHPTSAEHVLNFVEEKRAKTVYTDNTSEVLPPVIKSPQTALVSGTN